MSKKFILLLCLVSIFSITFSKQAYSVTDKIYKELSTFSKVLDIVDKVYVKPVSEKEAIRGAIDGMLTTLDPHTIYLPAKVYKSFSSDTKGRFGGVGIEVSVKNGVLTIISPIRDTPAWEAGLKANDRILRINGQSTKSMTLGQAVLKMRGSIGKKLSMTIWRQGKTRKVTLTRRMIKVSGLKFEIIDNKYAYARIVSFQEGVSKKLKKELSSYIRKNGKPKGIIIDLRDNPGGLLSEAVKMSDQFLKNGVIVSTKGRSKKKEIKKAHRKGTLSKVPMVLLINGGSASASEIVAGALSDQKRARLMGTKSFGKGSVQTVINLDNGDALKVTIAYYYTPNNKLIDGKGIKPDVLLDRKAYLKKNGIKDSEDTKITRDQYDEFQKQAALAYLKRINP
ncbi:hypothetical protein BVY03_02045 [bacterium K02(2017)]|nr:hypothetical protein BVY03_02045 [bacterium K02(2017)]